MYNRSSKDAKNHIIAELVKELYLQWSRNHSESCGNPKCQHDAIKGLDSQCDWPMPLILQTHLATPWPLTVTKE